MQINFMSPSVLSVLLPRNVPGSQKGGYTTHSTDQEPYSQPPMLPWVQPGMQPPIGPSPRSEHVPWYPPVLPAGFALPPGVAPRQGSRPMSAPWSSFQGPAGTHNASAGSYFPPSANESYFPYDSGGFVGQLEQNPPPMIPPRSQLNGSAGDWNPMAGSYSHSGQSVNGSYSSRPPSFFCPENPPPMTPSRSQHQGSVGDWNPIAGSYSHPSQSVNAPPAGFFCPQNPPPMTAASPYQGPARVQDALGPYP
jgi:hypothetical protein